MSNVLIFHPKYELECQKNYDDFIKFAKNELRIFEDYEYNGKKGWTCEKWTWITARGRKMTVVHGIGHNGVHYTPYRAPYADFAKAYVRYELSLNHKESKGWTYSLQWLYKALFEQAERKNEFTVDVMDINNSVINRVEELIKA